MSAEPQAHDPHALREGKEAPPRGVRAMAAVRWALLAIALGAAVWTTASYVQHAAGEHGASHGTHYRCPMHPQIVADAPGSCPICHMSLEPVAANAPPPQVPEPPPEASAGVPAPPLPGDVVAVSVTLDRAQAIGVRSVAAVARDAAPSLRVPASVVAPEQGASEVHVRAPGFIEQLRVAETGVRVRRGDEMLRLYAPDVYQAEVDLLAARGFSDAGPLAPARQRLELLGVASSVIDRVLASGTPERTIAIVAPADGWVVRKRATLGAYVGPDVSLYDLVDLSHVWIEADVAPRDAPRVSLGAVARFSPRTRADVVVEGHIDRLLPQLDDGSRRVRVRMRVPNPALALRPGEYGDLQIAMPAARVLVVPRDAVIDTGRAMYVFIDVGAGVYAPRSIVSAGGDGESILVAGGLAPGERVVAAATFLIDAESRLAASTGAKTR